MSAYNFLSNPVIVTLGWTLFHAVWQGFALVLPVAILLHILRNRSSTLRYRIGALTLLGQLLLSAITFIWYYTPADKLAFSTKLASEQPTAFRWQAMAQALPWHQQTRQFLEAHLSQFVLIYLIGVALFGLRLAGGWFYLQRLSRLAVQPTAQIWGQLATQLRSGLAIRTIVQVRESSRIVVPMVVGVLKPVLLVPIGLAANLSIREVEIILAHELAHIKRQDYAINLLQSVIEVLYFFHPALWWLSARVREEREHCCDDLAIQVCGGDGRILAQALAHVEELRLSQSTQTPILAMALTSKRQQLLHRVKRVLGVPTRPFVSNGSLAGLTLATLLLMSASVYAIQRQQDKPKSSETSPRSSRRHTTGNGTEYSILDDKKVGYVIWKGKKLPAGRVARLQRELDLVMAGQLSLDAVKQPDRDILLTIIETNSAFNGGMNALAEGLSHIDYSNIVASALNTVPLSPNGTVEGLREVDYSGIINKAMASVDTNILKQKKAVDTEEVSQYNQRQMDSLSQLVAQQSRQAQALQLQMEKMRFPIEEFQRNQEVLEWRKQRLMEERQKILEKRQQLLNSSNNSKTKIDPDAIEKQIEQLEPEIKKQEEKVEELNKQLEAATVKLEEARKPLEKLERENEQLDRQMNLLSVQLDNRSEELARLNLDLSDVNVSVNTDAIARVRAISRVASTPRPARVTVRPATPTLPPTPPTAVAPARVRGYIAPRAVPASPARVSTPRAAPKPAIAPFAEEPDQPAQPDKPARKVKKAKAGKPE
jgi:beta-lactamase regulating signal transducer with metallopeptidase domain/flagellar biosynthesis chaperone FliJ